MAETQTRMNPLIAAAAVAVIIFSAVGVGVMTGVIPSSKSASDSLTAPEAKVAVAPEAKAPPAPAAAKPAPHTTQKRPASADSSQRPAHVAMNDAPARSAAICNECGVVDAVQVINKKGESSPLGVAGGAVVGGIVGNQIGSGRGNTAATIVGAVGGAMAGNEVEKRIKSVKEYQVTVRMEGGNNRTFAFQNPPGYEVGDHVKVVDGRLVKG